MGERVLARCDQVSGSGPSGEGTGDPREMVVDGLHIQQWLAHSVERPIDRREDRALALHALVDRGRSHARRQGRDELGLLDASPERMLARLIEG